MEEPNFIMFEAFDFDHNDSFQAGWSVISKSIESAQIAPEFVRAKVFFFNKNVAKIDYEQYILWKCKNSSQTREYKQNENITQDGTYSSDISETPNNLLEAVHVQPVKVNSGHCNAENPTSSTQTAITYGQDPCVTSEEEIGDHKVSPIVNETEIECSLSLAELAELLQSNKPIPRLRALNVQPSNAEPTPSTLSRRLKPWESDACRSDFLLPLDKASSSARDCETVQPL
ncbi:unnamed protein product [Lymnaea stagnalis]|uniref:Uncharacterized protein n=1 Tax=Lymnaea stagnalis TaxID=6523 RepID=A0AAV2I1M0_LYMST